MRKKNVEFIKSKDDNDYLIIIYKGTTYASELKISEEELKILDEFLHERTA